MGGGNTVKGRDIIVPKHRVISIRVHALRWLILDQVIAGKKDRELFATVQVGGKRMTTKRRVSMIEDDEDEDSGRDDLVFRGPGVATAGFARVVIHDATHSRKNTVVGSAIVALGNNCRSRPRWHALCTHTRVRGALNVSGSSVILSETRARVTGDATGDLLVSVTSCLEGEDTIEGEEEAKGDRHVVCWLWDWELTAQSTSLRTDGVYSAVLTTNSVPPSAHEKGATTYNGETFVAETLDRVRLDPSSSVLPYKPVLVWDAPLAGVVSNGTESLRLSLRFYPDSGGNDDLGGVGSETFLPRSPLLPLPPPTSSHLLFPERIVHYSGGEGSSGVRASLAFDEGRQFQHLSHSNNSTMSNTSTRTRTPVNNLSVVHHSVPMVGAQKSHVVSLTPTYLVRNCVHGGERGRILSRSYLLFVRECPAFGTTNDAEFASILAVASTNRAVPFHFSKRKDTKKKAKTKTKTREGTYHREIQIRVVAVSKNKEVSDGSASSLFVSAWSAPILIGDARGKSAAECDGDGFPLLLRSVDGSSASEREGLILRVRTAQFKGPNSILVSVEDLNVGSGGGRRANSITIENHMFSSSLDNPRHVSVEVHCKPVPSRTRIPPSMLEDCEHFWEEMQGGVVLHDAHTHQKSISKKEEATSPPTIVMHQWNGTPVSEDHTVDVTVAVSYQDPTRWAVRPLYIPPGHEMRVSSSSGSSSSLTMPLLQGITDAETGRRIQIGALPTPPTAVLVELCAIDSGAVLVTRRLDRADIMRMANSAGGGVVELNIEPPGEHAAPALKPTRKLVFKVSYVWRVRTSTIDGKIDPHAQGNMQGPFKLDCFDNHSQDDRAEEKHIERRATRRPKKPYI